MKRTNKFKYMILLFAWLLCGFNVVSVYAEGAEEIITDTEEAIQSGQMEKDENSEIDVLANGVESEEIYEDGFVVVGDDVYYYVNGEKLTGHQSIEGERYYFDSVTGAMYRGEKVVGGHWVYYSEEDGTLATGWSNHHGKRYYYDDKGWMVYGKQEIDGKHYYFDTYYGTMYTGEKVVNGHWTYYSEEDGAMATGWTKHHGKQYYYDENGWMVYGKQEIDGKKYFFDTYYGVMYTGEKAVDGHWVYYSEEDGAMATGWTKHHGKQYYYDGNGWMVYGHQKIDGKQYFFDTYYGVMYRGEKAVNGHWVYYSEEDGAMAVGWTKHHGKQYYYDENGWMIYGHQEIDGKKYFFDTYYGVVYTGEKVVNGHWVYYSEKDGAMVTGWSEHHGKRYYYDANGWMVYGKQEIDGEFYVFHPVTGVLINANGIRKLDPNKPMIALTFDDGPSSYTPRILNKLEEYGQAATFFVVGPNAKSYSATIKRAYEMGCEIGNHTYSHPDLARYSYSGVANELAKVESIIYNATGSYSTVMRPPYGGYNSTVRNAVNTPIILWSVDTLDWKTRDTWSTVNHVLNYAGDGDIVLMHDIHSPTIAAAEILIPKLVQRGYQLVTVTELAYYRGNGMQNGSVYYGFY